MAAESEPFAFPGPLLPFQSKASDELHAHDCLLVMGEGMGLEEVICKFLLRLAWLEETILVLGNAVDAWHLRWNMRLSGLPISQLPVHISATTPAAERRRAYSRGGIVVLSARIGIVDLLTRRFGKVGGVLVLHVERATESSQEAFCVRIVREQHPDAWVKGVSARPSAITSGIHRAERLLRVLNLTQLSLWPRFRSEVSESLDSQAPEVVELAQPLSARMQTLQRYILEALGACISHLGAASGVDTEGLTTEHGLLPSFDSMLRHRLAPVWAKLTLAQRQMAADVPVLRRLLDHVLRFDAITVYHYLDLLRRASKHQDAPSLWIFTDAGDAVFSTAKARIYSIQPCPRSRIPPDPSQPDARALGDGEGEGGEGGEGGGAVVKGKDGKVYEFRNQLEPNPKWTLLLQVLEEVRATHKVIQSSSRLYAPRTGATCLVLAADDRTCEILSSLIEHRSAQPYLQSQLDAFLLQNAQDTASLRKRWQKQQHSQSSATPSTSSTSTSSSSSSSSISTGEGKGKGGEGDERREVGVEDEEEVLVSVEQRLLWREARHVVERMRREEAAEVVVDEEEVGEGGMTLTRLPRSQIAVASFTSTSSPSHLLMELRPTFVVCFDSSPAFTRAIEVYCGSEPKEHAIRAYFLVHDKSVEQKRYRVELERETKAFESLISTKALLARHRGEKEGGKSGKADDSAIHSDGGEWGALAVDPGGRKGRMEVGEVRLRSGSSRSKGAGEEKKRVIVDTREFRSRLPALLHQAGCELSPATLTVGDYVLSPDMCVERKSVPDLRSSFASGRMFVQAEALVRNYLTPILLIEFSAEQAFSFKRSGDEGEGVGENISPKALQSKLTLLTLHFPTLRILWSRTPEDTASLFYSLKQRKEEPDRTTAIRIGTDISPATASSSSTGSGGEHSSPVQRRNQSALDMLRSAPGVSSVGASRIASIVHSFAELCALTKAELARIIPKSEAEKLYDYLHKEATL